MVLGYVLFITMPIWVTLLVMGVFALLGKFPDDRECSQEYGAKHDSDG